MQPLEHWLEILEVAFKSGTEDNEITVDLRLSRHLRSQNNFSCLDK
jgi:hypothetical protein